jgi:hypothetical protein
MLVFGFELDVGVAVSVSRERTRRGEQTYYAVSFGPIDAERVRAQIREAGLTMPMSRMGP